MCRYCFEIFQHADFAGDWSGWRLRGRDLISPDGDRVSARRLRGLLTMEVLRPKKRVGRVAVVPAALHPSCGAFALQDPPATACGASP